MNQNNTTQNTIEKFTIAHSHLLDTLELQRSYFTRSISELNAALSKFCYADAANEKSETYSETASTIWTLGDALTKIEAQILKIQSQYVEQ